MLLCVAPGKIRWQSYFAKLCRQDTLQKSTSTPINLSMSSINRNTVPLDEYRPFIDSMRSSIVAHPCSERVNFVYILSCRPISLIYYVASLDVSFCFKFVCASRFLDGKSQIADSYIFFFIILIFCSFISAWM